MRGNVGLLICEYNDRLALAAVAVANVDAVQLRQLDLLMVADHPVVLERTDTLQGAPCTCCRPRVDPVDRDVPDLRMYLEGTGLAVVLQPVHGLEEAMLVKHPNRLAEQAEPRMDRNSQ